MSKYQKDFVKKLAIWGRELSINIIFDCYEDEIITQVQEYTLDSYLNNQDEYNKEAFLAFQTYCINEYPDEFSNVGFDNIFKYIIPNMIYIKNDYLNREMFGIICKFKYDLENDIACVFINGKIDSVGPNTVIL